MLPNVLVDFDGTVVLEDTTDLILERFADPAWREVEMSWVEGRIGSRECLSRQIDLVSASETDLDRLADEAEIDPGFPDFIAACRGLGLQPVIGSDGFDRIIARVLARAGVAVPVYSNRLVATGADRWRAEFPWFAADCRSQSGNCKCAQFADRPAPRLLVGDGRSDFCPAAQATFIFAKKALALHCRQMRLDHVEISGLADATRALATLFERRRSADAADKAGLYA